MNSKRAEVVLKAKESANWLWAMFLFVIYNWLLFVNLKSFYADSYSLFDF